MLIRSMFLHLDLIHLTFWRLHLMLTTETICFHKYALVSPSGKTVLVKPRDYTREVWKHLKLYFISIFIDLVCPLPTKIFKHNDHIAVWKVISPIEAMQAFIKSNPVHATPTFLAHSPTYFRNLIGFLLNH